MVAGKTRKNLQSSLHSRDARTAHFGYAEGGGVIHKFAHKLVNLVGRARKLDYHALVGDVKYHRAKSIAQAYYVLVDVGVEDDFDKQKFSGYGILLSKRSHRYSVHQLGSLLDHLFQRIVVAVDDYRNAGNKRIVGSANRQRIYVETTTSKKT